MKRVTLNIFQLFEYHRSIEHRTVRQEFVNEAAAAALPHVMLQGNGDLI